MSGKSLKVSINPEIIKWARESAGLSIKEASQKLKISTRNFKAIETGNKQPTFGQLEILAHCFKRPVAVFFLPQPPEESAITSAFRNLFYFKKQKIIDKREKHIEGLRDVMRDVVIELTGILMCIIEEINKQQANTTTKHKNKQKEVKNERTKSINSKHRK